MLLSLEGPKQTVGLVGCLFPNSQWQLCGSEIPCRETLKIPETGSPPQAPDSKTEAALTPNSMTRVLKLWDSETFSRNLRQIFLAILC